MNKLFSKIAALSVGLAMAIGVGVAVGSNGVREAKATDASMSIADYASANEWVNATAYEEVVLDSNVVASITNSGSNTGKYYTADNSWRFYAGESAQLTITTSSGTLSSVTLTYTVKDSGIMKYGSTTISSGTPVSVSGTSAVFDAGSSSGSKGKVFITNIAVSYSSGSSCDHNWVAGTVHAPTCTEAGYTEYECSLCHESKHDDEVAALGHNYGEWTEVTPASCLTAGEEKRVCSRDSTHVETRPIAALGHSYVDGICERCGAEEPNETTVSDTIANIGSSNNWTVASGSGTQTCYTSFKLDSIVEISTSGEANCGSFWNSTEWRLYQNKGGDLTITVPEGYALTKAIITFTTSNSGILLDGTTSVASESEQILSGTSKTYTVGNSGTATNGQVRVTAISVTYAKESDPSLNNMTIYLSDAAAEGQSVDYKSSGSYQFVAKEDSTALTDVTWSVSDETVATINASTGALSCVKPGSVTVYAEKDGYNKASASITIAKGSVSSLAVSGEMSKKAYSTAESWSHDGLVATATYSTGWAEDVSSSATWTYNPENPAEGVESVVASASFGGKSASSSAQAVTVTVAHAGTAEDPFTVAEGIAKCVEIGNKTGGEGPWVTTGVISKVVQVLTTGYQNARVYMTEDGKESSPSIYVYDFKYLENAGFTEETAAYIVVGATITVTGNLLNYNNNTPEYARGCYLLDIKQPETGDVDVKFAPASTSFEIGASGTFTASSETPGAVFTWAVDNPSVLSVNESTGAYEALSLGIARVTVTASAGGKEGYAFVDFAVCGAVGSPLSVAEANALAATVESGKTTSYYVYVEGYVKEFATSEKDGKPRALDIMSEDGISSIMVYTNVDPYAAFVDGLELGDYLKVKANVQNYSGKYELVTPEKVSNHASAFTFAFELLEQTDGQCATYVDGTSDYNEFKSFFEGKWGALEDAYNALASIEGEQTKVLNAIAKEDGNVLEQAMARYDFLVGKYKLDNFVTGRTPKAFVNSGLELSAVAENNTSIIIIVIAATSALAFTTLLVFKKKRQK